MWDIISKNCVLLSKSYKNDKGLGHSAQEWLWDKRKVSKSALLNVGLPMCLFVPLSAYVSNAHPSRNITTSSAALVITAKTVTPTLSHQIGAPHVSFSSSRWYIGPTSLHLSSLCTWQIVQLHVVWLFQSTGCTLLSWLLFVIQFLLPQNWLQLREGGAVRLGTALESHFVLVLALVLIVLVVLLVLAAALALHCPLPCNFPAPTCNLPLVGSYDNWKTEYQLLDQNACYLKAKTKWQNCSLAVDTLYYSWWGMTCHVGWWILIFVWVSH